MTLQQNLVFGHKTLSSRTKLTKIDEVMQPLFDNFLGIENNDSLKPILEKIGADKLLTILPLKWNSQSVSHDSYIDALTDAKQKLDNYVEKIYRYSVSPLVFYIGATGLLPDEINVKGLTSDELNGKYPNLKIAKTEQDGMFFEVGNTIVSVYPQNEYFSLN
ncbi:hypothetical protein [Cyanothece sp. BG0011]|uniref:hypothetical protein n=1 Tax=Cyanothece sp. BG0011 TaxID=2082950 RepID=UPI0018E50E23|nr:hypothetical protein [Cyanothece sp. BG0011]